MAGNTHVYKTPEWGTGITDSYKENLHVLVKESPRRQEGEEHTAPCQNSEFHTSGCDAEPHRGRFFPHCRLRRTTERPAIFCLQHPNKSNCQNLHSQCSEITFLPDTEGHWDLAHGHMA